jgi:hypothetical protein
MNSKIECDLKSREIYRDHFEKILIDARRSMSPFFALDVLFKYNMLEEACKFLYYRKEYEELLYLIK